MQNQIAVCPTTGKFSVRVEYRESSQPIIRVFYWTIIRTQGCVPHFYLPRKLEVRKFGDLKEHCYHCEQSAETSEHDVRWRELWAGGSNERFSGSIHGCPYTVWIDPKAQATTVEEILIDCPKVRKGIETRFRNERWEKYSKVKGWIMA